MPAAPDTPAFIGREAELAAVLGQAHAAAKGRPRLVLVTGDAGVGKSRLVAEATTRLAAAGFRAAVGGCVDIPGLAAAQVPFGPFAEAMRRLGDPAGLTWVRPRPASTTPDPARSDADPGFDRLADFLGTLETLTEQAALVLVLEDLHWADRSSLALLVFLARNLVSERLLVVGTARESAGRVDGETLPAIFDHLQRLPGVQRLSLPPLGDAEIRALIADPRPASASAGDPRPAPAGDTAAAVDLALAAVVARAEGNPLVAWELATHVADHAGAPLPRSLTAAVTERLRRAPPEVRAALAAAAVLGTTSDHGLLETVLAALLPESSSAERSTAVHAATGTGLLWPVGDGYRFRHGLDREVIYHELLPGDRRLLHEAAATALAATSSALTPDPGLAAEVAGHWWRSGKHAEARRSALTAARTARAVSAFPEALAQYEHVLSVTTSTLTQQDPGAQASLITEVAEVARLAGELDRGLTLLASAAELSVTPDQRAHVWERLGGFRREAGDDEGSVAAYERALAEISTFPESPAAARVRAAHARSLTMAGHFAAARDQAREALAVAERAGEPVALASALVTLGTLVAREGNESEGLALLAKGRDIAVEHGAQEERWRYVANVVYVLQNRGRTSEAVELARRELREFGERQSLPPLAHAALCNATDALFDLGQWDEARDLLQNGLRRRPAPRYAFQMLACRAKIELLRGDAAVAAATIDRVVSLGVTMREPDERATVARLLAEQALAAGEVASARGHVDTALARLLGSEEFETKIDVLAVALRIEADAGTMPGLSLPARCLELTLLLHDTAARVAHHPDARLEASLAAAEARRIPGEVAGGSGPLTATAAWQEVAQQAQLLRRPYLYAYAHLRLGEAALTQRRRQKAAATLRIALENARRLGASPLAELVLATATRAQLDLDGSSKRTVAAKRVPERAAALGLTPREVEVLSHLVEGATNRQISRTLSMSEKTASVHVSRILTKLGARNRGEAAAMTHRLRLLESPT